MKKFLKNNASFIGGIVLMIVVAVVFFKYLKDLIPNLGKDDRLVSSDNSINNVIDVIDATLGAYGTFNSDHKPLFDTLRQLSKYQLIKLHKDFGEVAYSPLTRGYKKITFLGWEGYSERKGLNGIYLAELDPLQLEELGSIYNSKKLSFPLV